MKKENILVGKKTGNSESASGFDLLFLWAAVYGMLFLLLSADAVQFQPWIAFPVAAIPGALLWYGKRKQKSRWLWGIFAVLLLSSLVSFLIPALQGELRALLSVFFQGGESTQRDVTGAVLLLGQVATLAVFLLELVFRTHWPMYLFTTLGLLIVPFLGLDPGIPAIFLFFAFQVAFWMMNGFSKKNQNYLSPHPSKGKKQRKNAVSVIMLSGVFLVSLFAVGWNAEWFYQAAYALLLTVVLFIVYRGIRLRAIKRMEIRKLFSRMKKALQFAGFFRKSGISEEKMLLELPQVIPGFTDAKADRLLAVLQEASFGSSPVGESRENEVRESYRQVMKALYQKLPFWKKPIFKYGKTFL